MKTRAQIARLLIANRGEIAFRILRTARKMGIKTYVLMTREEPNAPYLQEGDYIIDCTGYPLRNSVFMDLDYLIRVALDNKVDAIHPGYGFLSENYEFAKKCREAGLIFVGPNYEAIKKMGNKVLARKIAEDHGIPLVSGSEGTLESPEEAYEIAKELGFPVIIKACSGGGGKGMRVVKEPSKLREAYFLAQTEAQKSFGDSSVYLEKYLKGPRHVEFQVVADKYGHVIHLGERECSIQRKYQKLLEEAPSLVLDSQLREEIGTMACRICQLVNYQNLGTIEFLIDETGNYYFMEMNTRIQVEHPVTEMLSGLDLIALQLKMAQGDLLELQQSDVQLKGWSVELRINAEDVQANFSPSQGIIERMDFPARSDIRVDTGYHKGVLVPPNFDSLLAKLIVWGDDRADALEKAREALNYVHIKGIKTNVPFFKALLRNERFKKGQVGTSFVESEMEKLFHQEPEEEMIAAIIVLQDYLQEHAFGVPVNGKEIATGVSTWVLSQRLKV